MVEGKRRRLLAGWRRTLLLGVAGALVVAGVAMATGGLSNSSFENGLDGWSAATIVYSDPSTRAIAYSGAEPTPLCESDAPDETRVCLVEGSDDFHVNVGGTQQPWSISPFHGSRMVRLGGPFTGFWQEQDPNYRPQISQTFIVDHADPIVRLAYNILSWDDSIFDSVELRVTLTDENGAKIADLSRGAPDREDLLTSTGWQPAHFDLSAYRGQAVHLRASSGGTVDGFAGTWAYIDGLGAGGTLPPPPASAPTPTTISAKRRPPCAGLTGKRRARCLLDRQVARKCGAKHGKKRKACAKRVRAMARCRALPKKTRRQRAARTRCLSAARRPAARQEKARGKKGVRR
jgi:hypothetical protein